MAQAVFEEHPLEEYLRDAGEIPDVMPGGAHDFATEDPSDGVSGEMQGNSNTGWLRGIVMQALETLRSIVAAARSASEPNPFGERFKYDVISSSLLSTSISTSHSPTRQTSRVHIPGRLQGHTPMSSVDGHSDTESDHYPSLTRNYPPATTDFHYWPETAAFAAAATTTSFGHYFLSLLILGGTLYYMHINSTDAAFKYDIMTPTLDILNDLITAGNVWDSVVHESITILENDERSIFYGPTTPSSPSSSLRVTLQSSLHTTQAQCDNIRHLFSALTAPSELSQLSEMYAPPSPTHHTPSSLSRAHDNPRPLSHPGSPPRTIPSSTSFSPSANKRSTWNGSYATLASAGSPTSMHVLKRREKRRSDLSSLLVSAAGVSSSRKRSGSLSAAGETSAGSSPLSGLQEEEDSHATTPKEPGPDATDNDADQLHFGAVALDLQRKRKATALNLFGSALPASPRTDRSTPSSASPPSRFTTMQTTRHPLSLSALHHAVQGAVASKRYACSHLLALRFTEDDDEGYWEDVRSVMGLLTSTLVDASSRLTEALDGLEKTKLRDQIPSPPAAQQSGSFERSQHHHPLMSFAPMPSHLARFSAHVDTISTALDDARDHLDECIANLRDSSPHPDGLHTGLAYHPHPSQETLPALEAYERLRRELGLALRECERGRERLLDTVALRRHPVPNEDSTDSEDLPGLGHDLGSDESDKPDESTSPVFGSDDGGVGLIGISVITPDAADVDDATSHLLLTASSQHLPPPGIEQVFEAETGGEGSFTREKSKLSREERIKLMKARRQSGGGLGVGLPEDLVSRKPAMEMWGPGGEVVQELKDVIWKVGERRRKMAEGQPQTPPTQPDTTLTADTTS